MRLHYQICFMKCKPTFNQPLISSCQVPSSTDTEVLSSVTVSKCSMNISEGGWCQQQPWSAYKERLCVQETSTRPRSLHRLPKDSSSCLLLLFVCQHHGQRPGSPPHGHLLLRIPVARWCRGLLTGDALLGFPPENTTGERPGERFDQGYNGCEMCHVDDWILLVL